MCNTHVHRTGGERRGHETDIQRDRETERRRDRDTERQRDRETERQRDRERSLSLSFSLGLLHINMSINKRVPQILSWVCLCVYGGSHIPSGLHICESRRLAYEHAHRCDGMHLKWLANL